MLYEFALTPGIFDPQAITSNSHVARDLILFLDGLRDNGLVGDLCDGELRREIGRKLAAFPSGPLRDQLRFYLELMDKRQRFVTRAYIGPGWPGDELTWFDEALRSHQAENFYSIVTTDSNLRARASPRCTVAIGTVWQSQLWRDRSRSRHLERRATVFQKVLRPVLRNARSLMIIDPHIRPQESRFFRSLQALVRTAYDRHDPATLKIFEIHTQPPAFAPQTYSWFESELRGRLARLIPAGCSLRLVLWQERGVRFHNRFLLSNFCGVSLGQGFDESDSGIDYDDWELIDEPHREEVWRAFLTSGSPAHTKVYECFFP